MCHWYTGKGCTIVHIIFGNGTKIHRFICFFSQPSVHGADTLSHIDHVSLCHEQTIPWPNGHMQQCT